MTSNVADYIVEKLDGTYGPDQFTSLLRKWRIANSLEKQGDYYAHMVTQTGVTGFSDAEWTFWKNFSLSPSYLLQEDGTSFVLQEDGTSKIVL